MNKFISISDQSVLDDIVQKLVEVTELPEAIVKRFVSKFDVQESGCWKWNAASNDPKYAAMPYGRFYFETKFWVAHRWIYEQVNGPVRGDLVLDHYLHPQDSCIGPKCVNPDHLKQVTNKENILRGNGSGARNARKTSCPAGHKYDGTDSRGFRICSICETAGRKRRSALKVCA
jgi:hypothetical protein